MPRPEGQVFGWKLVMRILIAGAGRPQQRSAKVLSAFFVALVLGACGASPAVEASASTPVIVDGDTLTLDGARVRLWGVDAP